MGSLARKQKVDIIDKATISHVMDWWRSETKVNPNRSDVTRKRIDTKVYEEHATHLLLETQVRHVFLLIKLILDIYY